MSKPGFQPGQDLPEPEDHFTDDPLWKVKAKRVVYRAKNTKGLLAFFAISVAIALLLFTLTS